MKNVENEDTKNLKEISTSADGMAGWSCCMSAASCKALWSSAIGTCLHLGGIFGWSICIIAIWLFKAKLFTDVTKIFNLSGTNKEVRHP